MGPITYGSCLRLLIVIQVFLPTGFCDTDVKWEELSCAFNKDLCTWTTNTEEISQENSDEHGWKIYDSKDTELFDIPLNDKEISFAYVSIPHEISRAFLTSPATDVSKWDHGQTMSISFDYFTSGSPVLNLYVLLNDSGYKYIWSSSKSSSKESTIDGNNVSADNATLEQQTNSIDIELWKTEKLISLCQLSQVSGLLRLSFVAYLTPNDSVAISNFVTTTEQNIDGKPDNCTELLQPSSGSVIAPTDEISATWKFFIVFSLFLCFGAVFVSALLIVGKSTKTIYVPPNIEGGPNTVTDTLKTFKYRKLLENEES